MSSLVDNKCKHDLRQKIIGMPDANENNFWTKHLRVTYNIQTTFLDQTFECDIFYSNTFLAKHWNRKQNYGLIFH